MIIKNFNKDYFRIPKEITIGYNSWKIKVKDKVLDKNKKEVLGLCIFNKKTIKISKKSPNLLQTLFHEIQHAFRNDLNWINTELIIRTEAKHLSDLFYQLSPNGLILEKQKVVETDKELKQVKKELSKLKRKLNSRRKKNE